ncbi:hypothetical protein GE21DRAFT_1223683, partial [Neurospora crassa]
VNRKVEYYIKWKGYGYYNNNWMDIEKLKNVKEVVEDYWKYRLNERKFGVLYSYVNR